jgi:TPR repeat protein
MATLDHDVGVIGRYDTCDEGQQKCTYALMIGMLTLAVSNGVAFAGPFEETQAAYNRGDYATSLRLMKPLAAKGDAVAQTRIGWLHQKGLGVPKNDKEAIKWYRLAAAQGNDSAQSNLGKMYQTGEGVPLDYHEAIKWSRLAADQGNTRGETNLGTMYANGQGVPRDYDQAVKLFRLAAQRDWLRRRPT